MSARLVILLCTILVGVAAPSARASVDRPSVDREEVVVIRAGEVITGTGETIDRGIIVVINGAIAAVGRSVEYPRTARIIDAHDQVVMPGLVHARSRHGLPNYSRSGQRANLKASDEVYPGLIDYEPLLRNGYVAVASIPSGSGIPGRATVHRTGGAEAHRLLRETAYLRVTMTSAGRDKATFRGALQAAQREIDKVEAARKEWEKKQAEAKAAEQKSAETPNEAPKPGGTASDDGKAEPAKPEEPKEFVPPAIEAALRPIVSLIQGETGEVALLEINNAAGLLHAEDAMARHEALPVMFHLQGGSDFHNVVARLGERKALVLVGPDIVRLPLTVVRYNLVAELVLAGAEVAIVPSGSTDTVRAQVAELVRSGLPHDDAIRALTINPARVAGVDDRLGTIEVGKQADLIFLDSDPLDGLSRVIRTMIRGETVWAHGE